MQISRKIGGIILAGGEGKRIGGLNKGLVEFRSEFMINHILLKFKPYLDTVIISANRDLETYRSFGAAVYPDCAEWKHMGPLSGLVSCYPFLPSHLGGVLVVPCDTPLLPDDLVIKLAEKLFEQPDNQIAYAVTKDCVHPSIFLSRNEINAELSAHMKTGKRSLRSWIFSHKSVGVYFDNEYAFANINEYETLRDLEDGSTK